jgi:hypothetical protein
MLTDSILESFSRMGYSIEDCQQIKSKVTGVFEDTDGADKVVRSINTICTSAMLSIDLHRILGNYLSYLMVFAPK